MTLPRLRPASGTETKLVPGAPTPLSRRGAFEGYASLFGVPDLGRDVVMAGAFSDSLKRRGAAGIRMLWQHDPAEPVGRWLSLAEDARGLKVAGQLNLSVARARELAALIEGGGVDGLSIGFRAVEAVRDRRSGLRHLIRIDLWEVSVVTFPMHPGARVTPPAALSPDQDAPLALSIRRASARLSRRIAGSPERNA